MQKLLWRQRKTDVEVEISMDHDTGLWVLCLLLWDWLLCLLRQVETYRVGKCQYGNIPLTFCPFQRINCTSNDALPPYHAGAEIVSLEFNMIQIYGPKLIWLVVHLTEG